MPLNERKYLQQHQQESTRMNGEDNDSSHSFYDKLRHSILFDHDKKQNNVQERNLFGIYKPTLVDDCINQVLQELFSDKVIIESIRQRVADKINKL